MMSAVSEQRAKRPAAPQTKKDAKTDDGDPFGIALEIANAPRPRANKRSQVADFYRGRCVLITGASGFIGKVLIEKLLRTCPQIERIYVLIRPKWNKKPEERLRELLECRLYDSIRGNLSDFESRIVVAQGDVTQPGLGLNPVDLARITKEVSVIFHSAATVKFDEPLKHSIAINIAGTKHMIQLSRRCPKLTALVHVSTAYANCDRFQVDEHVYPVDMDPERLISMADWLDMDTLQELKKRLLGARPNTYTYTKAIAEWLLVKSARDLPVVVCRPSIVVASASEPFKGWIDNVNGPTGVVLGAGKGLIRSMFAEKEFVTDLVPVDKVISLIVTLGWFAHVNGKQQRKALRQQQQEQRKQLLSSSSVADSLSSDSLLVSSASSASGSSGGGDGSSSAASTSGTDDSLDDVRDDLHGHRRQQQRQERASHHQLRRNLHAVAKHDTDNIESSPEDESADLSLTSESSSTSSLDSPLGYDLNASTDQCQTDGCLFEAGRAPASTPTSRAISKRVGSERHHRRQERLLHPASGRWSRGHDDGYGSRSPSSYAAGLASTDTAAPAENSDRDNMRTVIQTICEKQQTTASEAVAPLSAINDSTPAGKLQKQHQQHQPQSHASSDKLDIKLNEFHELTLARLHEKGLPEELAQIPVFHFTSGAENPITWGQVQLFMIIALRMFPSISTYRFPSGSFTNKQNLDIFYRVTLHYVPAYIFDFISRLVGGKAGLVKIYNKFDQAARVLKAFTSNQWSFGHENRLFLMNELMNEEDKRLFDCDIKKLDWRQFCSDYVLGVRKFLLKEPVSTLQEAKRNLNYVYYRNWSLQIIFIACAFYYIVKLLTLFVN